MSALLRPGPAILLLCLLLIGIVVACGEEAIPTAAPATATPAATIAPAATTAVTPAQAPASAATQAPAPVAPTPTAAPASVDTPASTVEPTGTLKVAVEDFAQAIFVLHSQPFVEARYDNIITHETMFANDPDGNVVPRLVTDWSLSPDALVATFHLRQGVPWHDQYGDWGDFNADDFIWSMQDVTQPAYAPPRPPETSAGSSRATTAHSPSSMTTRCS